MKIHPAVPLALLLFLLPPEALPAQNRPVRATVDQETVENVWAELSKLQTRLQALTTASPATPGRGLPPLEDPRVAAELLWTARWIEGEIARLSRAPGPTGPIRGGAPSQIAADASRLLRAIEAANRSSGSRRGAFLEAKAIAGRLADALQEEYEPAWDQLKTLQRVYEIAPDYDATEPLLAQENTGTWEMAFERLSVHRHREKGSAGVPAGDEPYLIVLGFRSRFGVAGSTRVIANRYHHDSFAKNIAEGQSIPIPSSMGVLAFPDVRLLTAAEMRTGRMPELIGAVVIAMESDGTPWRQVEQLVERIRTATEIELRAAVENGTVDPENPGAALALANQKVGSAVLARTAEAVAIWAADLPMPDAVVGVEHLLFAALGEGFESPLRIASGAVWVSRLNPRTLSLRFTGAGADYEVTGRVIRRHD
jgi:hypothetical protein